MHHVVNDGKNRIDEVTELYKQNKCYSNITQEKIVLQTPNAIFNFGKKSHTSKGTFEVKTKLNLKTALIACLVKIFVTIFPD